MNDSDDRLQGRARVLVIGLTVAFALAFLPGLMVMGFSVYVFDTPGSGIMHELYVWGYFLLAAVMPIVAVFVTVFMWINYKRGRYGRARAVAMAGAAYLCLWLIPAYTLFLT